MYLKKNKNNPFILTWHMFVLQGQTSYLTGLTTLPLCIECSNQHFEAEWHMYASVNYTIIGSDNGLSPPRRQAIIWTNDGLLLIRTFGRNFSEIAIKLQKNFLIENTFENVSCKMATILSLLQCVKGLYIFLQCVICFAGDINMIYQSN